MKIGEALRKIRLKLGLSQAKMCEGIGQRPFYALVESSKSGISAESLMMLLIKHKIDINYFFELIAETYTPDDEKLNQTFQEEMNSAVLSKDVTLMSHTCTAILHSSNDEILKFRAIVTTSYFLDDVNLINNQLKLSIFKKFDENEKWIYSPDLLRLLANTMPIWDQEALDFLMERLLKTLEKDEKFSELMVERYLRMFENYLMVCYHRKAYKIRESHICIDEVIQTILGLTSSLHFMIYRFNAYYMHALFMENKEKAKKILGILGQMGYSELVASWPTV